MHTQYQHERQVNVIITRYHHEALSAEQLRLARAGRPHSLTGVIMSLGAPMTALVSAVGARFRHGTVPASEPVAEVRPFSLQDLAGEPTNAPVIA
jgi:hypothetical protein